MFRHASCALTDMRVALKVGGNGMAPGMVGKLRGRAYASEMNAVICWHGLLEGDERGMEVVVSLLLLSFRAPIQTFKLFSYKFLILFYFTSAYTAVGCRQLKHAMMPLIGSSVGLYVLFDW